MYNRLIILVLLFMGSPFSVVLADLLPDTSIQHETITHFIPGMRLALKAQLNDSTGVKEARCYFKTGPDEKYLYVAMNRQSGNAYQCSLPAFNIGSQTLEYYFLIVNGSRQVIRSTAYVITETDDNVVSHGKITADSSIVYVYSELGDTEKVDTSIVDDQIELMTTQDVNRLYGLRAGLYETDGTYEFLNSKPSYFGGFIVDKINNTIRPVKGFVPGLDQSFFEPDSPIVKYKTSSDLDLTSTDMELKSVEPPDIEGTDWVGYFTEAGTSIKENLTASVVVVGSVVTIETTLTGLGHYLTGEINLNGDMLLYDNYDEEDWTTHYGPASATSINIYDYVMLPASWELNEIILYRFPKPPVGVQASDGTCIENKIVISWEPADDATSYEVYACNSTLTDSCTFRSQVSTTQYDDTRMAAGAIPYRVKACNSHGCSEFSDYDMGYCRVAIAPVLRLLL